MKDYEFITEVEWEDGLYTRLDINKFLNDKCQKGMTIIEEGLHLTVYNVKDDPQMTHDTFLFHQEIEPEKVECDLDHKTLAAAFEMTVTDMYRVLPPCPKCGKALSK